MPFWCRCRLMYAVYFQCVISIMYVFLVIKYPYFTYRVDVEDRWRRTESSYYKTKNNTSSRTVLVNRSAETGDLCPLWPPGLGDEIKSVDVSGVPPPLATIIADNSHVLSGGISRPVDCAARQRIAVIITYKDRWSHLLHLLSHLHPLLQKQQAHYQIYVVEQVTEGVFNKGRMYNSGFVMAMADEDWDCVVLHDVDLVPETESNLYRCVAESPLHLSAGVDSLRYTLMYPELVGGVLAMTPEHYRKSNGFSNSFWGWGGEDDDMESRIKNAGMSVLHTSTQNGRYKMVPHAKRKPSPDRYMYLRNEDTWRKDGLNSMQFLDCHVTSVHRHALYTNISVEVGATPPKIRSNR